MIHDFATLPRTPKTVRPVPEARKTRRPIGRILLATVIVIAALAAKRWLPAEAPEPDFVPGAREASEYQAAMEIEAAEASREQKGKPAKAAEKPSPISSEIAAFEEKLKNARSGEPQFGFYDSLAGSSWSVPVQRGVYITEEDRKRAGQRYLLQAASVRDLAEAQRLVQKLRSLGMEASYQSADPAGAGWYRVNVGPFDNVSRMNKAEDTLVSLRMMPLKRRIP